MTIKAKANAKAITKTKTKAKTKKKLSALQSALGLLKAVKADPSILKGRKVTPIDDLIGTCDMPIAEYLTLARNLKPVPVQRNDLYRLENGQAQHLGTFQLPQSTLVLVYWDKTLWILDGNARTRLWLDSPGSEVPSKVTVTVLVAVSRDEASTYYNCYDANGPCKTTRDSLLGMFRDAGLAPESLRSNLAAGGKLVTVLNHITRQTYSGSARAGRLAQTVKDYIEVVPDLDRLGLEESDICAGGIWALMRLYKELPREFCGYVDKYAIELKNLRSKAGLPVAESVRSTQDAARRACEAAGLGASGTKRVAAMFPEYFEGFWRYGRQLVRAGQADAKFAQYLPRLKKTVVAPEVSKTRQVFTRSFV